MGWNIGANDTANCIGTVVGCGLLSFRRAMMIVAAFSILGAVLQGHNVSNTIGKDIVKTDLDYLAILVILICSGFFVTLATFFKIPVSTSQAIVGGVMGIGLAVKAQINYAKFVLIAESWVICPLLVMGLAFAFYHLLILIIRRIPLNPFLIHNSLGWMAKLCACYVAFSMGANNAGNAIGPVANLNMIALQWLLLWGGLAIAVGAITYGRKVADTVGKGITPLNLPSAFAAQLSSAMGLHLFSILGIPVSTSSAIVGAVVGVGLVKGAKSIRKETIITIIAGWVLTPALAAGTTFCLFKLLKTVWS